MDSHLSMKEPILISVILPVYNAAEYVEEAIKSILDQTYPNFELIILNDGSTDNSIDKIKLFKDSRIRLINDPQNRGLVYRLNQGLDLARGTYIARMDADDYSVPIRFEKQVAFLEAHPEIGVLSSWFEVMENAKIIKQPNDHEDILLRMLTHCPITHPAVMIRASILKTGIRYKPKYFPVEDYHFWIDLVQHTKFANLPEPLLLYRWHEEKVSEKHMEAQNSMREDAKKKAWEQIFGIQLMQSEYRHLNAFAVNRTEDILFISALIRALRKVHRANLRARQISKRKWRQFLIKKQIKLLGKFKDCTPSLLGLFRMPYFFSIKPKLSLKFALKCMTYHQSRLN